MKHHTTKIITAGLAIAALATMPAQAATWVGPATGEEYSTATNWSDTLVPASNSTQDINGAFTVDRSVNSTAGRTFVRGGGVLNVTGGAHNDNMSGSTRWNFVGSGATGTVNQSGGTYEIGHGLRIGTGTSSSSNGAYNLSSGHLSIYRGSDSSIDVSNPGGRPSLEVGGTAGTALFEISGNASMETRGGVHLGATGTFSVVGSSVSSIGIGSNQSGDGTWIQTAGGTLSATIDLSGVTPIFVDDVDADGDVQADFRSGSILDLSFGGVSPYAGTWTILELENAAITDGGLGLSGSTAAGWSFEIDNDGTNGLLLATYVPEPSTTMVLGLALLGGLGIRRRRA